MWIVVGVANNQSLADKMKKVLEDEGVLVKIRSASVRTGRLGSMLEVMVLESEADLSREALMEKGF